MKLGVSHFQRPHLGKLKQRRLKEFENIVYRLERSKKMNRIEINDAKFPRKLR